MLLTVTFAMIIKKLVQSSLFLLLLLHYGQCARILCAVFTPSFSHQSTFRPIWKQLLKNGHELVLLTTDPMRDSTLSNLTEIDLSKSYEVMERHNVSKLLSNPEGSILSKLNQYIRALSDTAKFQMQHEEVQKLIHEKNKKFDLLIVEVAYPTQLAFAEWFQIPFIGLSSLDALPRIHQAVGNPSHPILNPDVALPFTTNLTFKERCFSVFFYGFMILYSRFFMYPKEDATVKEIFGNDISPLNEIEKKMDMLFININPVFHKVRPLGPNTIQVGGGIHLKPPQPLPEDIQTFLDSATNGAIYFSLGTNVKSNALNENTRKAILKTFANLPYKVLWKFENETMTDKSNNIMIRNWLPQQDVLRHKNIKLFITQCGLQSLEEAILNHIPMIGLPFFGDQLVNAKVLSEKGLGLSLKHQSLTVEELNESIVEVITNPKYKANVIEADYLYKDVEMAGLDKAIWWTEYVIRHKGAKHFKNPVVDLPVYQYYLLDVIGFATVVLCIILYIIAKLFKVICYLLFSKKIKKD